jgi:transcriptional regulator with XRE-family HTH domain
MESWESCQLIYGGQLMLRFLDQLAVLLNRRRESPNAFAARVEVSHSTMGRIMQGLRAPDVDQLEAWANALELDGDEREAFLLAGALANCPRPALDYVARMEDDLADLKKRAEIAEAMLDRLERRVESPAPAPAPRSRSSDR